MPKIPDFSKFDLQSIVNSVKSIINPDMTPNVTEGDPIGTKVVQISALLQSVADAQSKSAKDLTQINNLLNDLYKDLEAFRKLEAELKQKQYEQQAAQTEGTSTTTSRATATPSTPHTPPNTGTQRSVNPKPTPVTPKKTGLKEGETTIHPGGKTGPSDSK